MIKEFQTYTIIHNIAVRRAFLMHEELRMVITH